MNEVRTLPEWLAYIERQHPKSIAMGLERVREVAARMGLQKPANRVITVGGTNGKGSTVAYIEAIARAAGWRVGAYTSPHLLAYNERVRIDGVDADDAALVEAFAAVDRAASGALATTGPNVAAGLVDGGGQPSSAAIPLTYFEYGTLAALWLFERGGLDLAILEVGLGGRLDATNLVDPDVAVISTVDLDHQDYLGEDRERIGAEKAGIARAWKPLVLGEDDPPSSVLGHAYAIGASAIRAGCDYFFEALAAAEGDEDLAQPAPGAWIWHEVGFELVLPPPGMPAQVQLRNAATAIAALRALGAEIPAAAYSAGVASARIAARMQSLHRDGVEVVVDVAHNPQAARELATWLRGRPSGGRTLAVFAALADKDVAAVAGALGDAIHRWHLAGLGEAGARGSDVDSFATRLASTPAGAGSRHADVAAALRAAHAEARVGDRILVFGSFHTAAAALAWLGASPQDSAGG